MEYAIQNRMEGWVIGLQAQCAEVQKYYDENSQMEWERLERHPFELPLTLYMMEKYIRPGDRVLDIGGGPGRYSIHFAKMGCDVTLVDLSPGNIRFAQQKAAEAGVKFAAYAANCLELDRLNLGEFDHVLLMGPLYHLKEDDDRQKAVEQALLQLKTGGNLYASFILNFAGAIYDLKNGGYVEQDFADGTPTAALIDDILQGRDYIGPSFSSTRFSHQNNILPFMAQFPLTKLHLFGQEGILSPNESELMKRSEGEIRCWIEIAKRLLEVPELLAMSEHAMYIGQKNG